MMAGLSGALTASARVAVTALQTSPGMGPLPAEPPIGGAIWTVVIPAVLLLGSFLGTYLLYKRFSKEEGE